MRNHIFANLGFLLQTSGLLTLIPIGIGLYFNETPQLVPLFLVCVAFLGSGFLLNALCERKDLDFKSSSILLLVAFVILPLIGAIPYVYSDPFTSPNVLDRFTNGYFESVSGFTTTGFSFITNPDILPRSMLVYRSLTELMGGVGVVFLILAFFQSKKGMGNLGNTLGIDNLNGNLKKMFLSVFVIYGGYIAVFIGLFYGLGFTDVIKTGSFTIDTLTGGFSPSSLEFGQYLFLGPKILIIILMFIGSVNFSFNYYLFTRKIKQVISAEVAMFLGIIAFATVAIYLATQAPFIDSLFHVVSMASSTGYDYLNIMSLNGTAVSIFISLILIGGCTFSMAGGIRMGRLVTFAKSLRQSIKGIYIKENALAKGKSSDINYAEYVPALIAILLFIVFLVVFAMLFTTMGVSFSDAIFEVGSALSTNGVSMGATTVTMPIAHKWLMVAAMTIGRVEILTIIIALIPYKLLKKD